MYTTSPKPRLNLSTWNLGFAVCHSRISSQVLELNTAALGVSANLILFHPKTMGLPRIPTILLLLLTLPRVIALFTYPDGSSCWECDFKDKSCLSSDNGCSRGPEECGGAKVPDGYVIDPTLRERYRSCYSTNGCSHMCTISSKAGIIMVQRCCFKAGSQVCAFGIRGWWNLWSILLIWRVIIVLMRLGL